MRFLQNTVLVVSAHTVWEAAILDLHSPSIPARLSLYARVRHTLSRTLTASREIPFT